MVCTASVSLGLCRYAKKILMLFSIQSKFEYFNSIFIDANYVNALILVNFGLQLEFCDKICDHFEIQNDNKEIDTVSRRIDIDLPRTMICKPKYRYQPCPNHCNLQDEQNSRILLV